METPGDRLYTREHEWARMEKDGRVTVGVTWYAQDQLGDVVFVELPEVGAEITVDEPFGVIESVKTVSDLFAPVSGEVVAVNGALDDEPQIVNSDPYEAGWLLVIRPSKLEQEVGGLLSPADYGEHTGAGG